MHQLELKARACHCQVVCAKAQARSLTAIQTHLWRLTHTALGLTRMTPGLSAVRHTVWPSRRHSASLTARQPPRSTCVGFRASSTLVWMPQGMDTIATGLAEETHRLWTEGGMQRFLTALSKDCTRSLASALACECHCSVAVQESLSALSRICEGKHRQVSTNADA